MPHKKKIICINGHELNIVGRNKSGRCKACCRDRSKRIRKKRKEGEYIPVIIKPLCIRGHEIAIVGRDQGGHCRECAREDNRKDPELKKLCPQGHNKDIVGRIKDGKCKLCIHNRNEKNKEKRRQWREDNQERIHSQDKEYRQTHREERNEYIINLKRTSVEFRLRCALRARLNNALKNNLKTGSAVKDLGCSSAFLKIYIEAKFHDGMTWDNWGPIWHLDHKKALWKFNLSNREEFLQACNYINLQPLTIKEHREKTAREKKEYLQLKRLEKLALDKTR